MINEEIKNDISKLMELDKSRLKISNKWDDHVKSTIVRYYKARCMGEHYYNGPTEDSMCGAWRVCYDNTIECEWTDECSDHIDSGKIYMPMEYIYNDVALDLYVKQCDEDFAEKLKQKEQGIRENMLRQYNALKEKLNL